MTNSPAHQRHFPPRQIGSRPGELFAETMKKHDFRENNEADRARAGKKVYDRIDPGEMSSRDKDYLIHELQAHQIELSMQNEELRAAQQELEESRRKYRQLYDSAPVAYLTLNREGYIRDVNLAALQLFGAEKHLLLNRPLAPFIHPDNLNDFRDHLATVFATESIETRAVVMKKKDGTEFPAELRSMAANDNSGESGSCSTAIIKHDGRLELERDLRTREEEFRSMFELSAVGKAQVDPKSCRFVRVNQHFCTITGYSATELLGMSFDDLTYTDDRKPTAECYERVLRKEMPDWKAEKRYVRKDGAVIWVKITGTVMFGPAGEPYRVMAVIEDITENRHAEQALRESEERYRSLVESLPEGIIVLQAGMCLYVNRAGLDLLRARSLDEVRGRRILDFVHPDFREKAEKRIRQMEENGHNLPPEELRVLRLDGQEVDVEAASTPIVFGGRRSVQILIKDITDRWQSELRLRLQATVLSQVNDAVVAAGLDRRIIFWNKGAERLFKLSADEAIGKRREDIYRYRRPAPEQDRIAKETTASSRFLRGENVHVLWNGEEIHVESSVSMLLSWSGLPAGWLAVMRNITERKEFEQKLRESEERYRSLVESSPDAIMVYQDDKIVYANPATRILLRAADVNDIVNRSASCFFHQDFLAAFDGRFPESKMNSTPSARETVVLRLDGSSVPVESVGTPIRYRERPAAQIIAKDITERKKFEEALRNSEQTYRLMFESNPHPMWFYDPDTLSFQSVNDAAISHYGYSRSEFLSMTLKDIQPREDRAFDTVSTVGRSDTGTWRHRKKDGTVIDVEIISQGLMVNGKDARVVLAHDVTARKRAEHALHDSQQAYRTLAENLPGIVYRVFSRENNRIQFFNRAASSIIGYTAEELAGGLVGSLEELTLPEDRGEVVAAVYKAVKEKKSFIVEYRLRNRNGEIHYLMEQGTPVYDSKGSLLYIDGVISDITERKRAEDELKRARTELELRVKERTGELAATIDALQAEIAERRRTAAERDKLVAAVESAAEAIVVTDKRGIIQYVNPAFEQVTGFVRQEALGGNVHIFDSGQHDEEFFRQMRETIRTEGVWKGRLINKKKDGTIYYEDCTYSPVKDASGTVVNYVSIKHDVTEKLRLEAIAETVDAMNNIGYVFSGIRHEIGNPVSSLLIIMSLLKKKYETGPRETIGEYIDQAISQVERIEYLLTSLKSFNMYENLQVRQVNVVSFFEKLVPLVTSDLAKKSILLQAAMPPADCLLAADPRALQQALLNIIVNASDAVAGQADPVIALTVLRTGAMVRIRVSDNGAGISDERKKDLFKPFYTTKAHGTGLGLVISRKLVSRMNGFIEITSRVNKGTSVDIYLPEGSSERTIEQKKDSPGH